MGRIFYSSIFFTVFLLSVTYSQVQTVNGKIKITIGTTAGCGDTVTFVSQLNQVYDKYKEFLQLEFVPWGRTRRNESGVLVCQFGDNDCFANRLHRCALDMLKENQDAQMHYMSCEFSPPYPGFLQRSLLCAQAVGLSLIDIDYCLSTTGDALEDVAQEISTEPIAVINFVPFIVFNDDINIIQHQQARQRLESLLCFALADDSNSGVTHCRI